MNLFKSFTLSWWQTGMLKFSLFAIGLAIGSHWASVVAPYAVPLFIVGFFAGLYLLVVWFRQ